VRSLASQSEPTEKVLQNRVSDKRRSERVKLTVSLMVTSTMIDGREAQELVHTAIVNAHGGLFRSTVEFLVAQPLVLINLNTNSTESARVVHAESLDNGGFGVAFEFDNAAPEFWQIEKAPGDWGVAGLSGFSSEVAN
jgi:hypothetical protein